METRFRASVVTEEDVKEKEVDNTHTLMIFLVRIARLKALKVKRNFSDYLSGGQRDAELASRMAQLQSLKAL